MTQDSSLNTSLRRVALIGNPNTGKSTLFNALTGMQARVGNFPGVTVEKKVGRLHFENRMAELLDLPGTYSLSPRSLDEMVSVEVLLGQRKDTDRLDAVVCIVDASNLERNLYLVSQVLDLGLPTILVLNMWDVAQARQVSIDVESLRQRLGIPVIVCEAHRRMGVDDVRRAIVHSDTLTVPARQRPFPEPFYQECAALDAFLTAHGQRRTPFYLVERLLLDVHGQIEESHIARHGGELQTYLTETRTRLAEAGCRIPLVEARARYAWAREKLAGVVSVPKSRPRTRSDSIDSVLTHRFAGLFVFAAMMYVIFQALFSWSGPLMDMIETGQGMLADYVAGGVPPGPMRSLLIDGVIAGVGGVLVFLPQIAMLFFFIAIMEDCGYMARAAFVMDRLMTKLGLSGKSFVPLMSSFACAIPGVMAARTIENRRDRMVTILVAPLMSCSARLPVYILLTTAFVPEELRTAVLFLMYSLGLIVAVPVAFLLKKTVFKGETPPFVMELPPYKWPSTRIVLSRVYDRSRAFVARAGTLIFATTILIWGAGYFPGDRLAFHETERRIERRQEDLQRLESQGRADEARQAAADIEALSGDLRRQSADLIESSFLGTAGHAIEPVVRPLGWDWKIGIGVIASFPAREVIISTLGTIYSLGNEVDIEDDEQRKSLEDRMYASRHADGTPVFNIVVACSVMVFFALCAQCASTLMVIQRETGSWKWAAFTFFYMTTLAYVAALITARVGMLLLA